MAKLKSELDKRGVKAIGLSVDAVDRHQGWARDIEETQGLAPNFPMIGDPTLAVAKLYDMLPAEALGESGSRTAADNQTVRRSFLQPILHGNVRVHGDRRPGRDGDPARAGREPVMKHLTAFISGLLFAAGLAISGMVQPAKVVGVLDITGAWDPTLAFVMGGALLVFVPGCRWATRRARPIVTEHFDLPTQTEITRQLLAGAAIFGIGWGVTGLCPGVAIAALPSLTPAALTVTFGIALGITGMRLTREAGAARVAVAPVSRL